MEKDYIKEMIDNTVFLPCGCGGIDHNLIFKIDTDEQPQVWLYYQLEKRPWYNRIWLGIKYIFGFQSKFGMYGELLINKSNVHILKRIVEAVEENPDA